jgi:hypothetical protein
MNHAKKKKLKAKGWTIGSVTEFLKLSSAEIALIELRVRLSDASAKPRRAGTSKP